MFGSKDLDIAVVGKFTSMRVKAAPLERSFSLEPRGVFTDRGEFDLPNESFTLGDHSASEPVCSEHHANPVEGGSKHPGCSGNGDVLGLSGHIKNRKFYGALYLIGPILVNSFLVLMTKRAGRRKLSTADK
jgi:hypothetical protein